MLRVGLYHTGIVVALLTPAVAVLCNPALKEHAAQSVVRGYGSMLLGAFIASFVALMATGYYRIPSTKDMQFWATSGVSGAVLGAILLCFGIFLYE